MLCVTLDVASSGNVMHTNVFISYSSIDEKRAKQLAKALSDIDIDYRKNV